MHMFTWMSTKLMWMPADMSYHSFQLDLLDFLWSYHVIFVVLEVVAIAAGHGDVRERGTVGVVLASSGYITRSAPDRRGSSGSRVEGLSHLVASTSGDVVQET